MYSLVFAVLLLVSINALTQVPSARPTADETISTLPTPSPSSNLSPAISRVPTKSPINGALSRCIATDTPLDIIFMIDSSGSVFDDEYNNWQYELDLVYDIVDNVIPSNSRVALINFSGCGSSFTLEQCKSQGRFQKMISLSSNGSPNDLDAVLSTIDAIGQDDFLGGYTWTDEALGLALEEFVSNSTADSDKIIVLITDGEPYPTNQGHEPCKSSTGFVSDTLQALQALDVGIVTVGIDIADDAKEEYFDCISGTDFYFEGTFDSSSLSPTAASNSNDAPSLLPTPAPVSQAQALSDGDTPSPTSGSGINLTTSPTSNAVPTYHPSPSPITAVEDLSDSIGDFICSELGSSRLIIPTTKPTPMPTIVSLQGLCESTTELDIVFMVDSSGSVYDEDYDNWQSQLDLVNDIVNSLPATSSRASLINFSGCGSSFTFEQCQEQGRFDTVFELNSYGNDLESVSARIEEMDSSDFNGGFTWTNEALGLALNQFNTYSESDTTKIIVLLTDGEPYPYDEGHEPCLTTTNYESDTLIALKELGVNIITVGIDISEDIKKEKLDCLSDSYLGGSQFSTLESLSVQISSLICDNINGDFSTLTLTPTARPVTDATFVPTPSPVTNPSSIEPTPSPTKLDESTRGPITSNGIMANIYINIAVIAGFIMVVLF